MASLYNNGTTLCIIFLYTMKNAFCLIVLVLLFAVSPASGQTEIKLVPQSYHTDQIETICFSPDGSKIATGGKDKSIKVWDVKNSKLICTFSGYLFRVTALSFSADGKYLISDGDMRAVKLWNIAQGKEEDFFKSKELMLDFVHGIAIDSKGEQLVSCNQKGDLKIFNFKTQQLIYSYKVPEGKVEQLGFCGNDKKIYAFSNTWGGRVVTIETGKMELQVGVANTVSKITYNPLHNTYALGYKDGNIEVKDNTHKVIKKWKQIGTEVSDLKYSPNGEYIIAEYGMYNYFIWSTANFEPKYNEARIVNYSFSLKDSLAAIAYKNGLVKIITTKNNKITSITSQHQLHTVLDINSNDGYCALLNDDNTIHIHEVVNGTEAKVLKSQTEGYPLKAVFTENKLISVFFSTGNVSSYSLSNLKQSANTGSDIDLNSSTRIKKSGEVVYQINNNSITSYTNDGSNLKNIHTFDKPPIMADISADGNYVAAIYEKNIQVINIDDEEKGFKYTTGTDGALNLAISADNENVYVINSLKKIVKYSLTAKRKVFEMADPSGLSTQEQGEKSKFFPLLETIDAKYSIHVGEKFNIHVRNSDGTVYKTLSGHTDHIHWLEFDSAQQQLVSASEDGTVKIWDWKKGELLLTLIASGENWVMVTPDNYYFNNKDGYHLLGFKINDKALPFELFDIEYNRPDKVLEKIGGDEKWIQNFYLAHQKRLKKEGVQATSTIADITNLPEISIKNAAQIPLQTTTGVLAFTVKISGELGRKGKLAVWVNGVPENPANNKSLLIKNKEAQVKINLSAGENKIKVVFINDAGIESTPEVFEIKYSPATAVKPNLYVLCIGVSQYKNPDMNLKYASKDSRDLAQQFATVKGFTKITIDTLIDKNATRENILGWKKKLITAKPDDMVIICLSGHGLLDDSMNFYFATHDIDFKSPAKRGLLYEEIEGLLAGTSARKRLLMLDACHSGEADKNALEEVSEEISLASGKKGTIKTYKYRTSELLEEVANEKTISLFDLMSEMFTNLNRGSGTVVISAAAGNSYALEADEWENGVFTFSVLEVLKNKTADYNSDEKITISELRKYVSNNVATLTNNRQKPTSRSENKDMDWVVWE